MSLRAALVATLVASAATAHAAGPEEMAVTYAAPPATEAASPAVTADELSGASAVALAISLGRVETALGECRAIREDVSGLIGDRPGARSVDAGWLRAYQACVLARAGEAKAVGEAIRERQGALLAQQGDGEAVTDEAAARANDLMARLSARQSEVRLAVRRELDQQKALVRYYNTGERPAELAGGAAAGGAWPL